MTETIGAYCTWDLTASLSRFITNTFDDGESSSSKLVLAFLFLTGGMFTATVRNRRSTDESDKAESYNKFTNNNNNKYYILHTCSAKSKYWKSISNHVNGCGAQGMPILITLSHFRSATDADYHNVTNTDGMRMNTVLENLHVTCCMQSNGNSDWCAIVCSNKTKSELFALWSFCTACHLVIPYCEG